MRRIVLGSLFLYFITCGMAFSGNAAKVEPTALKFKEKEWQTCRTDQDCVSAPSACFGYFWAINRKFVKENEAQIARLQSMVDCMPAPKESQHDVKPTCDDGVCALPPPRVVKPIDEVEKQ